MIRRAADQATTTCPECRTPIANVQGVESCPDCGWDEQ